MKYRFAEDARHWWRWHSTKAIIALGLLPSVWFELPPEWKAEIPSAWMRIAALVVMAIGLYTRVTLQKPPKEKADGS